jgi:hypothetical protein
VKIVDVNFVRAVPVFLTLFLIVWTILVSPYSKYGDNWAIYPALLVLPIVVIWHVYLIVTQQPRSSFVLYGAVHSIGLFAIWIYCLMKISKDAL